MDPIQMKQTRISGELSTLKVLLSTIFHTFCEVAITFATLVKKESGFWDLSYKIGPKHLCTMIIYRL